jgi:hypothetical protein
MLKRGASSKFRGSSGVVVVNLRRNVIGGSFATTPNNYQTGDAHIGRIFGRSPKFFSVRLSRKKISIGAISHLLCLI